MVPHSPATSPINWDWGGGFPRFAAKVEYLRISCCFASSQNSRLGLYRQLRCRCAWGSKHGDLTLTFSHLSITTLLPLFCRFVGLLSSPVYICEYPLTPPARPLSLKTHDEWSKPVGDTARVDTPSGALRRWRRIESMRGDTIGGWR